MKPPGHVRVQLCCCMICHPDGCASCEYLSAVSSACSITILTATVDACLCMVYRICQDKSMLTYQMEHKRHCHFGKSCGCSFVQGDAGAGAGK